MDWIKVNVDMAYKESGLAIAMVVRDSKGNPLYIASKLIKSSSPLTPHDAEIKALDWASSYAIGCNWTNFIWVSEAKEAVKKILDSSLPSG